MGVFLTKKYLTHWKLRDFSDRTVSAHLTKIHLKPSKTSDIISYNYTFLILIKSLFAACKKDVPEIQLTVNVFKGVGGSVRPSTRTYLMGPTLKILERPTPVYKI